MGFSVAGLKPATTPAIRHLIDGVSAIVIIARWDKEFKIDEFFELIRFAKSLLGAAHSPDESAVAIYPHVWFSSAKLRG